MNLSSSEDESEYDDGSILPSFNDNDEDGDVDDDGDITTILEKSQTKFLASVDKKTVDPTQANTASAGSAYHQRDSDDDSDDDDIDWEDASLPEDEDMQNHQHEHQHDGAQLHYNQSSVATHTDTSTSIATPRSFPTRDVILDIHDVQKDNADERATNPETRKRKRGTKRKLNKLRHAHLPPTAQDLITNLHRAHMLTLTGRAMYVSSALCSNSLLLHVAHSLIPSDLIDRLQLARYHHHPKYDRKQVDKGWQNRHDKGGGNSTESSPPQSILLPDEASMLKFCRWFFDFLHGVEDRRRRILELNIAAGAPLLPLRSTNWRRRSTRTGQNRTSAHSGGRKRRGTKTAPSHINKRKDNAFDDGKDLANNENGTGIHGDNKNGDDYNVSFSDNIEDQHMYNSKLGTRSMIDKWINRFLKIFDYLSPIHDDNPVFQNHANDGVHQDITISPLEQVIVFICMTRSLGWRVRYVSALDPIEKDVTPHHPIFTSSLKCAFHSILRGGRVPSQFESKPSSASFDSKKYKKTQKDTNTDRNGGMLQSYEINEIQDYSNDDLQSYSSGGYTWVEILCILNKSKETATENVQRHSPESKPKSQWLHVDPHCKLVNKPLMVEEIRQREGFHFSKKLIAKGKRKSRDPVSFVLAVEHCNLSTQTATASSLRMDEHVHQYQVLFASTRLTDVSPRYANAWSVTLRRRGATAKDIAGGGGKCANLWWSDTLHKVNRFCMRRGRKLGIGKSIKLKKVHDVSARKVKTEILVKNEIKLDVKVERSKDGNDEIIVIDEDSCEERTNEMQSHHGASVTNDIDVDVAVHDEELESDTEQQELIASKEREAIPTSKVAFKNHPMYVIPSVLNSQQVLAPDSRKRVCGVFKGELVYKRSDVSTAMVPQKWLYCGRKVRAGELSNPIKTVKGRKKPTKRGFQVLESYGVSSLNNQAQDEKSLNGKINLEESDGMNRLYGVWQTDKWSPPPVGPNDVIPVNKHKNVELALLNPGLVHLEQHRISLVAKQLGIPYAPCLLGFEGHGGNATPTIRGIVVHEHNQDLLLEAHTEWESQSVEREYEDHQKEIYKRWRRLIMGITTQDRLEREYANDWV